MLKMSSRAGLVMLLGSLGGGPVPSLLAAAPAPPAELSDIKTRMNAAQSGDPESKPGAPVYREFCSACHEGQTQKAPTKTFLGMMSPESIYDALTLGVMQPIGARMSD